MNGEPHSTVIAQALLWAYVFAGCLCCRLWGHYAESGKTFLLLVFPVHVLVYLPFYAFGPARVWECVRDVIAILVWLYLFLLFSR